MSTACVRQWSRLLLSCALLGAGSELNSETGGAPGILYVISACTHYYAPVTFSASLYRVDESRGEAVPIRELVPASDGTQYILFDPELRVWVGTYPSLTPTRFSIVPLDNPEKGRLAEYKYRSENIGIVQASLFALPAGTALGLKLVEGFGLERTEFLKELVLSTGAMTDGDWADYRYIRAAGGVGGIQPYTDGVFEVFPFSDGVLTVRHASRAIEIGVRLPPELRFDPDDIVLAHVSNPNWIVLGSRLTSPERKGKLGTSLFRIGEPATGKWHEWSVPGDASSVRAWRDWFAVRVESEGLREKVSPGSEVRRKKPTATGYPFDEYWANECYLPGTLIVYNAATRKQYTIETQQGDSEVLLIEDDRIYYRTNDQIWRGRIGAKSITDVELLLKAPYIPDVHWMFRSKVSK